MIVVTLAMVSGVVPPTKVRTPPAAHIRVNVSALPTTNATPIPFTVIGVAVQKSSRLNVAVWTGQSVQAFPVHVGSTEPLMALETMTPIAVYEQHAKGRYDDLLLCFKCCHQFKNW